MSSTADRVRLHGPDELRGEPGRVAAEAAARIAVQVSGWWLVDLDVLDANQFRASGAAGDPAMPEGLTWADLTDITKTALGAAQEADEITISHRQQ